ncbi:Uncharacterised protein [Vibrio cholerae]|nr:Uncharacterised protein [Vibrio cholerae]
MPLWLSNSTSGTTCGRNTSFKPMPNSASIITSVDSGTSDCGA